MVVSSIKYSTVTLENHRQISNIFLKVILGKIKINYRKTEIVMCDYTKLILFFYYHSKMNR